jgi:hypothetical protein
VIIDQGEKWNAEFGIQFDVRNLFAEEWFDVYMLIFAQEIDDTTKADIGTALQEAMAGGWTIDEMSSAIDLLFDKYISGRGIDCSAEGLKPSEVWFCERKPRWRRDLISRTETIRASNAGSVALFQAWGVVELKEWLATADDRTRSTHLRAWSDYSEGGTPGPIPLGNEFHVGGETLLFPGDPSADISETANCRCSVIPFFVEFPESQEEIDRAQGFIEGELARRDETGL